MYSKREPENDSIKKFQVDSEEDTVETGGIIVDEDSYLKHLFKMSPEKGFDLLFRKYYSKLCSHSIRYVHSRTPAEDIVSEVFVNFWQKKIYEDIEISFRAYLYRSVQFRSYNYLKREFLRQGEEVQEADFKTSTDKPDEILFYHELSEKFDNIIKGLPQQSRKAFQMSRLEDKKYSEIADELNITVSAVERLISRALQKIRSELTSYLI